jgi:hypothetical protein
MHGRDTGINYTENQVLFSKTLKISSFRPEYELERRGNASCYNRNSRRVRAWLGKLGCGNQADADEELRTVHILFTRSLKKILKGPDRPDDGV